jgi:hypothetical protein
MYDDWSESTREAILNRLENEVIHFARASVSQDRKEQAHKVLEKTTKILPPSQEMQQLLAEVGA